MANREGVASEMRRTLVSGAPAAEGADNYDCVCVQPFRTLHRFAFSPHGFDQDPSDM
jgi:hypothetical protein